MNYNNKKFKILDQQKFPNHRHGWDDVVKSLQCLHKDNGVLLESTIDVKFTYNFKKYYDTFPTTEPWIGFSHLTPNKPINNKYIRYYNLKDAFLNDQDIIKKSLKHCKGLYVLSKYVENYLINLLDNIPVYTVYHPTELNVPTFDINNYNKTIIHCGFFLRKFHSFVKLKTKYVKKFLYPNYYTDLVSNIAEQDILANCNETQIKEFYNEIPKIASLTNNEYDSLLSHNLIFVDFYDSSANNTIIECIARNNPILVPRHPAIIEYLGDDYPMYFDSLDEATYKINPTYIRLGYDYLNSKNKTFLTTEYFLNQIYSSSIYQNLL